MDLLKLAHASGAEFQRGLDPHDNVFTFTDRKAGLRAIVALHRPRCGIAMGATRLLPYPDVDAALTDALRLSRAMTHKAACADLPVGGGKAVIIASPGEKTEAMLRAYARFIDSLGGAFITGQDMNLSQNDIEIMAEVTRHVTGVSRSSVGPALMTARGVLAGMSAAARVKLGAASLSGIRVAIDGVGAVGAHLATLLVDVGAEVVVADLDPERAASVAATIGATSVAKATLLDEDVDVYAPCGAGSVLNPATISRLNAAVVAGAANDQLQDAERDGLLLERRGIAYCPDFVINAGGLIEVYHQHFGYDALQVEAAVAAIGPRIARILGDAGAAAIPPHEAARRDSARRLAEPTVPNVS